MLCDVCKDSLEGIWDPLRTKRLELRENFNMNRGELSLQPTASQVRREVERYVFGHHEIRDSFLRSKAVGCVQCSQYNSGHGTGELGYFLVFTVRFGAECIWVDVNCGGKGNLSFMAPSAASGFPLGLNVNLSISTAHQTTQDLILRWFSTCTKSHNRCNAPGVNGSFMPRRVLKICKSGRTVLFQLVDGIECAVGSAYIALSYCWGSQPASQTYRLLESTVQAMRGKQSVTVLPKTVRDAIEIASYFRVRYLWVDRLCIFQDSTTDFQSEASAMADIYKNAIVTIAALGALDADGGCFFERDPRLVAPTPVRIQHDRDGIPTPYLFPRDTEWSWQSTMRSEPLLQRAWAVQERLLARRVVYFGSKQIFWECKHAHWCETNPGDDYQSRNSARSMATRDERWGHIWERSLEEGIENDAKTALSRSLRLLSRLKTGHGFNGVILAVGAFPIRLEVNEPYEQTFAEWRDIVTLFSKCSLTVPSDKLVALSGLANEMRCKLEEMRPGGRHRYVAGLWEEEIPGVLPWCVLEPATRAASYRAPTWSWASIDGLVSFPQKNLGGPFMISSLVAVEVQQRSGEAETGQVRRASITLLGPVLRARLSLTEGWRRSNLLAFNVVSIRQVSDPVIDVYRDSEAREPLGLLIWNSRVHFDTLDDVRQDVFPIIIRRSQDEIEGIAVIVNDVESCIYQRVGYFRGHFLNQDDLQKFVAKFPSRIVAIVWHIFPEAMALNNG